jgi:hypothetical protein
LLVPPGPPNSGRTTPSEEKQTGFFEDVPVGSSVTVTVEEVTGLVVATSVQRNWDRQPV